MGGQWQGLQAVLAEAVASVVEKLVHHAKGWDNVRSVAAKVSALLVAGMRVPYLPNPAYNSVPSPA